MVQVGRITPRPGAGVVREARYIDCETGLVIARQNPPVDTEGEVRVQAPDVLVSRTTHGAVRIQYAPITPSHRPTRSTATP